MIEIQSDTGTWYQRWGVRALSLGGQVMRMGWWRERRERWRGGQDLILCVWVMGKLKLGGRAEKWGI